MDTVSDVTAACKTAVEILNDLLCFDMLESGILELHKQEIAVLPFLYDNIQLFSTQARGIGVDLTVAAGTIDLEGHSAGIALLLADSWVARPLHSEDCMYVDKFKMDQVIRNLISNALKFTPRGGSVCVTATFIPEYVERFKSNKSRKNSEFPRNPTSSRESSGKMVARKGSPNHFSFRRVYVEEPAVPESVGPKCLPRSIETVAGKLVVVVRDTGAGISAINQKRLFNEICQFNPEILQAGGGSGLGLWITRGIVDLHDSTISVYSAGEGRGCVFTLEIPMQRRNPTPDQPLGPGATSRRASGDQDEMFALRKSEGWRYLMRQLGE
jgi:signal transduction histidine kinase